MIESADLPPYEIRRSARRQRTISARREGDRIVVLAPARLTAREEAELVPALVRKLVRKQHRRSARLGDEQLLRRARALSRTYLAPVLGTVPVPASVSWVGNQRTRWGSCTTSTGEIRLSERLQTMPDWVVDAVLLHEVIHLVEPQHSSSFHDLLSTYPRLAEAEAFLRGYSLAAHVEAGAGMPPDEGMAGDVDPEA